MSYDPTSPFATLGIQQFLDRIPPGWFTIDQLFCQLGFEPVKDATWPAGDRARDMWVRAYGQLPFKALATKTTGVGSHGKAIYPPQWRERLSELVRTLAEEQARQGSLL